MLALLGQMPRGGAGMGLLMLGGAALVAVAVTTGMLVLGVVGGLMIGRGGLAALTGARGAGHGRRLSGQPISSVECSGIRHPDGSSSPAARMPGLGQHFKSRRRSVLVMLAPVLVYAIVRPMVSSDALGLGIAGAVPIIYSIGLGIACRRIDLLVLLSAVSFSIACLVSLLTGGSSLPLKLQEAPITFAIGMVLLIAPMIGHPIPLARLMRVPSPNKNIDSSLGVLLGGFLVLHALLHLTLAVSLSTSSFLVLSKVIDWGTVALGIPALSIYGRRLQTANTNGSQQ